MPGRTVEGVHARCQCHSFHLALSSVGPIVVHDAAESWVTVAVLCAVVSEYLALAYSVGAQPAHALVVGGTLTTIVEHSVDRQGRAALADSALSEHLGEGGIAARRVLLVGGVDPGVDLLVADVAVLTGRAVLQAYVGDGARAGVAEAHIGAQVHSA